MEHQFEIEFAIVDKDPHWRVIRLAFQIMTLVLGRWATMGSFHPLHHRLSRKTLKAMLIDGIERLIA